MRFSVDLVGGAGVRQRPAGFGELALEPAALLDEIDDARRQLGGRRAQRRCGLAQHPLFLGEICLGRGAGQRFDPAHARSDRHFADDLEQPDVAGAADMRAAAQLDREGLLVVTRSAHRDDPHLVAVFLAEQRQRPFGDGAVRGQQAGAHRAVGPNALVDLGLDRPDVLLRQRPRVAEIEAQPVGRDERALLRHMLAEAPAQRLMQQMGDRVIGAQQPAARSRRP